MPDEYDRSMTQTPFANAMAIGAGRPVIVLDCGLVDLGDEETLRVVLAHECAHVLSDHVLYRTALAILLSLTTAVRLPWLAGLALAHAAGRRHRRRRARPRRVPQAGGRVRRGRQGLRPRLDRIVSGEYPRRGDPVDVRAHADEAAALYAERFRAVMRDAADGIASAGDQLAEWLRRDPSGRVRRGASSGDIRR